jgi:hypothetical protein
MKTEPSPPQDLPAGVPAEAVPFLQEVGYLEPDHLSIGEWAPDVPVFMPEGDAVPLSRCWAERPAVLIFASYT